MVLIHLRHSAIAVLLLYMFHIVRNISSAYFFLLGASLLFFSFYFIVNIRKIKFQSIFFIIYFSWFFASLISIITINDLSDVFIGLTRFWTAIPLIFVAIVLSTQSIETPVKIMSVFFGVAALFYPWQYSFGAIEWFADSSERAGGERFASLVGSLTAYGVNLSFPLLGTLIYFKGVKRTALFCLIVMGALLSLQKAAIVNVFIVLLGACYLGTLKITTLVYISLIFTSIISSILYYDPKDGALGILSNQILGLLTSDIDISGDVTLWESVLERITTLPAEAIGYYSNEFLMITGVGVVGGAGALGYPDVPMAHNGLVEIYLIFGLFFGSFISLFLIYFLFISISGLKFRKNIHNIELRFLYFTYILWFFNYLFSGGALFHPIGSAIVWLVISRIIFLRKANASRKIYKIHASTAT